MSRIVSSLLLELPSDGWLWPWAEVIDKVDIEFVAMEDGIEDVIDPLLELKDNDSFSS